MRISESLSGTATPSGIGFRRPRSFWLGTTMVSAGVLLHLPMFLASKDDGYRLEGMPWDTTMIVGMALIVAGVAVVVYGIAPRFERGKAASGVDLEFKALDTIHLGWAHIRLMLALTIAIAVDTEKPFTFTFILPGVANEYDLRSPTHPAPGHWPVALFPFVAIGGTVIGSLVWGYLGDRIGRRASILLAATAFMATSACGAMPAFHWNLVMCFLMGAAAGGLLPIAYSLLTETIPVRRRGQLVVLVAGIGTALGFLLTSWTANLLIPTYGWRIMWFFNLPTGLALIVLNRYMPESPRFLLGNRRRSEAHAVMRTFGIVVTGKEPETHEPESESPAHGIFRRPHTAITFTLILFGLAWGLANFGFLVWLPTYVARNGISAGAVTAILAKAALFAIPVAPLVSWLYGRWSSRSTLILAAGSTATTLGLFALFGSTITRSSALFTALVVALLVSMWASISVLAPYSAEVYPTHKRSAGSGVAAAASKLGGVLALAMSVAAVAPPSVAGAALLAAIPAALAALMLAVFGVETRGRRLEEITSPVALETARQLQDQARSASGSERKSA